MDLQFKIIKPLPVSDKPLSTFVFIDYEYLYISFKKMYSIPPLLNLIVDDIRSFAKVSKISVFGDFTKPYISQERNRIRTITNNIIDCGYGDDANPKDFTDFIMLDHIYQDLYQVSVKQYIFVTGDGHFSSVAAFVKAHRNKTVGIYGVTGTLSRQLRECSSWTKEITAVEGETLEYQINILRNLKDAEVRGKIPTFMKTAEFTQRRYGGDMFQYENTLRSMIDEGYIIVSLCTALEGREFKMLSVDWERANKELLNNVPV